MAGSALNLRAEYLTWYDFKRELEAQLGRGLPVNWWLRAKPKKPLPWNDLDLRHTLSEVLKIQQASKRELQGYGSEY